MNLDVPVTEPTLIAPETWVIPNLVAADPGTYLPVNSMVIRGEQPVVIDTGAPVHREPWFEKIFALLDPEDVRWVFLSHEDGDHKGQLFELLDLCPQAVLVMNFFSNERQALEEALPIARQRWLEPGDTLDVGDRKLHMLLPPIFDGPATRGLFDDRTGAMWAVDSFATLVTSGSLDRRDVPQDVYDETFALFNSMISPWHQWLDPGRYGRHVDSVARFSPSAVGTAHGPVLTGEAIDDAFDRVRRLAGEPRLMPPGQELLDELITEVLALAPTQEPEPPAAQAPAPA